MVVLSFKASNQPYHIYSKISSIHDLSWVAEII